MSKIQGDARIHYVDPTAKFEKKIGHFFQVDSFLPSMRSSWHILFNSWFTVLQKKSQASVDIFESVACD